MAWEIIVNTKYSPSPCNQSALGIITHKGPHHLGSMELFRHLEMVSKHSERLKRPNPEKGTEMNVGS